jgi:hypothetical protein
MRSVGPAGPVVAGLFLLLPAAARAQGLDNDDTSFLNDVRSLILPEEKAAFEKLEDKADRLEFQRIFWARRDPDLGAPQNEFQTQYERDRAIADRRYSVPGYGGLRHRLRPALHPARKAGRDRARHEPDPGGPRR